MKKSVLAVSVLVLLLITSSAMAGTNTGGLLPSNGKEQPGNSGTKETGKYSFTLFSFFNTDNQKAKSDTSVTEVKQADPKFKKPVKTDL